MIIAEKTVEEAAVVSMEPNGLKPKVNTFCPNQIKDGKSYLKMAGGVTRQNRELVLRLISESPLYSGASEEVRQVVNDMTTKELLKLQLNWRGNVDSFSNLVRECLSPRKRVLLQEEIVEEELIRVVFPPKLKED